jgi:uncharacterized protein YutE (UPF0331/DUF86 family)
LDLNNGKLKKILYDLEATTENLNKSIELIKKYSTNEELKEEFSNSLKYKYLSLFIIYEDFISMLLKEYTLYEIGMSMERALTILNERGYLKTEHFNFFNSARLIRNKIGHRYKQPPIEGVIEFLESNRTILKEIYDFIKGYFMTT